MSHTIGVRCVLGLVCMGLGGMMASPAFAVSAMTVVDENTPMLYIEALGDLPDSGSPAGWTASVYNTAQDNGKGDTDNGDHSGNWQPGVYGVGYADADDFTPVDHTDNSTFSVYTRCAFGVANAAAIQAMTLEVNYDDGYIAWINGVEVARSATMPAGPAAWNTTSASHENTAAPERVNISTFAGALVSGQNTLAIGVWNNGAASSDLSLRPRLTLYDGPYVAPPAHTYLTWQGDPCTTMTVNYQTGDPAGASTVRYDTVSHGGVLADYAFTATGASHKIAGLDAYVVRNIHWVQLTGLTPGQDYYFVAGDGTTAVSREMRFRTPPSGDAAVRFVVGGDMDIFQTVGMLHRQAARQNPMFAWMTGDLAVCDGNLANFGDWDTWLSMWEENMITQDRRMIPMVLCTGNHEVNGAYGQTWDKAPFYFGYFAQDPAAYPPTDPKAYFSRRFGANVMICALNSGHVHAVAGAQTTWFQNELTAAAGIPYRFAGWHVPMYPSERSYTDANVLDVRTNWLPVVDQFQLPAVFEGHDHVEKRTRPLRNGNVDPNGTVYLGDGYGTQGLRPGVQAGAWYLERAESRHHLWLVEVPSSCVTGAAATYTAIDEYGAAFDSFQKRSNAAAAATLVPAGSVWKYLDNGTDQGAAWQAAGFNDAAWLSGPAELGYGDAPVTAVGYGPDANNKYVTTYFRKTFTVADPALYGDLQFRLKRDDGAVVYLNGAEVYRFNQAPTGAVAYTDLATVAVGNPDEEAFFLSPRLMNSLVPGSNTLAVEIHQQAATSTDLSFDLELLAYPPAATVLSPKGATWKYLDNGTNQGTAWRASSFNDTAWNSGPAELGYGEGDEATIVGYGPDANNKYVTTYFRRQFTVADTSKFRAYALRAVRDDGIVVYLNGVEVYRNYMPAGVPAYTTPAGNTVNTGWEEDYYYPSGELDNVLLNGTNTLAVEVHQINLTSSDLSFDLELVGIAGLNAIDAAAGPNGTVLPAGTTSVQDGNSQTYTINPNPGYHIEEVLVDCVSVGSVGSHTFSSVTAPHEISATFAINTYAITCNTVGSGTCTASPNPVDHGATSTVTVTPAPGWHLVGVVESVDGPQAGSYTTSAVTAARTVTATFAVNSHAITCNTVGSGTCTASPNPVDHGAASAVTVMPAPGWHLVSVVDSVDGPQAGSYTTSAVTDARTVTATFEVNTYALTYTAGSGGSISGPSPQTVNYGGNSELVSAVPAPGYHFVQWSDGYTGTGRVESFVIADLSVTALFAVNTYAVSCNTVGSGNCTASPNPVDHGATSDVTVTPAPGWYLVSVVDSVDGPQAGSYTTSAVTAARTVTATFAALPQVPDLTGMTASAAAAALGAAGLGTGSVTQQTDAAVPAGRVISQSPPANTAVPPNSTVDYVLSLGPPISLSYHGDNPVGAAPGERVELTVVPSNAHGTVNFQWYKVSGAQVLEVVNGATSASLVFESVTSEDSGAYVCEVTDDHDSAQSPQVVLAVDRGLPVAGWVVLLVLCAAVLAGGFRAGRSRRAD